MDRKAFLTGGLSKSKTEKQAYSIPNTRGITTGLAPYAGVWDKAAAIHLLKRTTFGAKKQHLDTILGMTVGNAVDALLNISTAQLNPLPPLKNYPNSINPIADPDNAIPQGSTWVNTNNPNGDVDGPRIYYSLKPWWIGKIHNQDMNILEKMVLFWNNTLVTEIKEFRAIWGYQYCSILRKNAIGDYKSLLKEISLSPAMLRYLNGDQNTKTAPDENFGRELQELFTVGKGRDNATPPYSEEDVIAAAKVLTGWQINYTTNVNIFNANRHDITNKQFSAYYNNYVVVGKTGATGGALELDDLMNMIFAKNDVSLNIVRKLYRFFIYYEIPDDVEQNVIIPLAAQFKASNYDIKTILVTLFKSEHFFDVLNRGCLIKSPLDHLIGSLRELAITSQPETDYVTNYLHWLDIRSLGGVLQQEIGDPPNVAGWPAYYQQPSYHEVWINADTYPKRNQYTDIFATNGFTRNGIKMALDPVVFAKTLSNPSDPNVLIADAVQLMLGVTLSVTLRNQLKTDILLQGQTSDYYWTNAWNAFLANPNDTANGNIVKTKVKALVQYLMRLPEYQLS